MEWKKASLQIITTVLAGIILALWVSECKQRREMADDVLLMKQKLLKEKQNANGEKK